MCIPIPLLLVLLLVSHVQSESDTLLQGQVFHASDYLTSDDGTFRLGFFRFGYTRNWYLGIAYNKLSDTETGEVALEDPKLVSGNSNGRSFGYPSHNIVWIGNRYTETGEVALEDPKLVSGNSNGRSFGYPSHNIVWIGNRDIPIDNDSGTLIIDEYGKLKIFSPGMSPIILSSVQRPGNVSATLLDSGNFVLKEENGGKVLWQSFDYPTNTLLPGMKIGMNFKTGHTWSLTSWINSNVPAMGSFTLGLDPNGSIQLVMWQRGEVFWRSGLWNEDHFDKIPKLFDNSENSFSFISTPDESYFTYSVKRKYTFPRYRLSSVGLVFDKGNIAPFGICAPSLRYFNYKYLYFIGNSSEHEPGCVDIYGKRPSCRIDNSYIQVRSGLIYGHGFVYKNRNLSISDCSVLCFKDCSCLAFSYINDDNKTGCEVWNETMEFIESYSNVHDIISTRNVYFFYKGQLPSESEYPNPTPAPAPLWRLISIGTSVFLLLLVLCFMIFSFGKRFRLLAISMLVLRTLGNLISMWSVMAYEGIRSSIENANSSRQLRQERLINELIDMRRNPQRRYRGARNSHILQFFKFASIAEATDNFSPAKKLGEGGFGSVYKGKLEDGLEVAIKRLAINSVQGVDEFKNELILIAKLQHTNLVRLVGCCINREEKMLIYEYMPNKSLDFFLFDPSRRYVLDWRKRFNIAEGIAQGLSYLHRYSRLKIIHRDLKAGNILLDQEMTPKISDFGMAKIFGNQQSRANTNRVAGTFGYMPPEYAMEGVFSMKSDVYSFGVILLEIVSGRMNNSFYDPENPMSLTGYTWEMWREGKEIEVIDDALKENDETYNENEVIRCIHVGLLCVQENPDDRPTMMDVVAMISYETIPLSSPKQPAFFVHRASSSSSPHVEFHGESEINSSQGSSPHSN